MRGVIVRRLAVIFRGLACVDAVRKRNIRTSACIGTEAVQLVFMFVFLLRHVSLIPMVFRYAETGENLSIKDTAKGRKEKLHAHGIF